MMTGKVITPEEAKAELDLYMAKIRALWVELEQLSGPEIKCQVCGLRYRRVARYDGTTEERAFAE